ncbi:hypothetical protein C7212DRAFT_278896 [Tuber magnatum]|uniref:Uncharacterized protein n=1 Tax=Tuber magnatum TaxID=42249 RepID=A0A317STN2_9PEZI|nr:hypothetical protein C7212DRAFT_278896 [Tuber magnatum]
MRGERRKEKGRSATYIMERPNILSALGTQMVALRAADSEVYIHRALVDNVVMGFGECSWPCFSGATITSFVEYLYQGNYTTPAAVAASSDSPKSTCISLPVLASGAIPLPAPESLDYEKVFPAHAGLFILSRHRNVLPLATLCLKRLEEAMKKAQDASKEHVFVENMRALIRYSYNPCCSGNKGAWEELQKVVSEFLVSKKGWLLTAPGTDLIYGEEKLAKDIFAGAINLLLENDKLLMAAERPKLGVKNTGSKSGEKRQVSTIRIPVKEEVWRGQCLSNGASSPTSLV